MLSLPFGINSPGSYESESTSETMNPLGYLAIFLGSNNCKVFAQQKNETCIHSLRTGFLSSKTVDSEATVTGIFMFPSINNKFGR
jgi:hypothetical protein